MTRKTLVAILLASAAHWSFAAEPTKPQAAAKLILEKGWEKSAAAQKVVDTEFAAMSAQAPKDATLLAAHWMALANHSRYKDSLASLNAFLDGQKDSLPGWQTKVFAHAALQAYPDAVQASKELAKVLAQKSANEQTEGLAFLGRFAGFLANCLPNPANAEQQKKFEEQILEPFDATQKQVFEKEKEAVLTKLKQFEDEAAKKAVEGQKAAADAAQNASARLQKDKDKLVEAAKKLAEKPQQVEDETTRAIDILNKRIPVANKQIIDLQGKKKPIVDSLAKVLPEARQVQQAADQAKDPQIRQQLQAKAQPLVAKAQGYQIQIEGFDDDIAKWNREKKSVEDQIQTTKQNRDKQLLILGKKQQDIDQDIQNIEVKLKRLETNTPAGPRKAIALPPHARYFSTYAQLPLDDWRKRLQQKLP